MRLHKIIITVIILAILAYPVWRIQDHSKVFAERIFDHTEAMGSWTYSKIESSLGGKITIHDAVFTPTGFRQGFVLDQIQISANVLELLLSAKNDVASKLPENLKVSFNSISLNTNGQDLNKAIHQASYGNLVIGYLGSFACGDISDLSFSPEQWEEILPEPVIHNLEFTYSLTDSYHIDFNVNIDSNELWFVNWSGTLTRSSDVGHINFGDTFIDTLYYYHVDKGFNQKRNNVCIQKHKDSFAAYRLNSAATLQQFLRVNAHKELPDKLNNQYQRLLAEGAEVNAIFRFKDRKYITAFFNMDQKDFFAASTLEAAIGEGDYLTIELEDIDHLDLNIDLLREQLEERTRVAVKKLADEQKANEKRKVTPIRIGDTTKSRTIPKSAWHQAVGKTVKIKTKRGRPVFGKLVAANDKLITISIQFVSGNSTISIKTKNVLVMTTND
ncbi:MAG: hypothetical protein L3J52_00785 [Proteobacteria bacterium]|nr:hypothetical protein [Pseudomonadota bacterium]